jgi:nicotinamide-nucleotide amidase
VIFKTVVGDRRAHMAGAIRVALGRADIVITMGGLGPTEDDLTRQAVADALGIRLRRNADIVGALYARFASHRAQMTDNNARQADVLDGSVVMENTCGTAPGQWLDTAYGEHRKLVILLPGPPHEVKAMFDLECMGRLRAIAPKRAIAKRTLKAAMIGESQADARIAPIYTRYHDVETTILAHAGDITLHLISRKPTLEAAQQRVDELAGKIEEELDEFIYSSQGEALEQIVLDYLGMRGATLAVAESCTGGLIAERLTGISGSSRSFLGGAVVYSDELKTVLAGVPKSLLQEHGAVSREVAASLAEGIRYKTSATYGIGVTGIAGPGGGSEEKPVGLVYVALCNGKNTSVMERRFTGGRDGIRFRASQQALDMVRRQLM